MEFSTTQRSPCRVKSNIRFCRHCFRVSALQNWFPRRQTQTLRIDCARVSVSLPGKHQAKDKAEKHQDQESNNEKSGKLGPLPLACRLPPHVTFRKDALKRPSRRVRCERSLTMPTKMGSRNVCLEAGNTDLQLLRFLNFNRRDSVGGFHIEYNNSGMPGL